MSLPTHRPAWGWSSPGKGTHRAPLPLSPFSPRLLILTSRSINPIVMENLTTADSSAAAASATAARPTTPGRWKRISRSRALPLPGPEDMEPGVPVYPEGFTPPPAGSGSGSGDDGLPLCLLPGFGFRVASFVPPPPIMLPPPEKSEASWPSKPKVLKRGSKEEAEADARLKQELLAQADELEQESEDGCETEEDKAAFRAFKVKFAAVYRNLASTDSRPLVFRAGPTDTQEEHLTAEDMEMRVGGPACPQACHFAKLALAHYNSTKKTHKFELGRVLLSKCFCEADGTTFAHVNFTAAPQHSPTDKRLFFAELMLIPDLQAYEGMEPMRVLHVCTIDDSCFGGCHEIKRDIKEPVRKNLDYERCHACSDRIKHPKGAQFIAGHDSTRTPYVSVFAWTYKG